MGMYKYIRWFFALILKIFFNEVQVVGKANIPKTGPVIFVGNHRNQFMDGCLLISACKSRRIRFLIAAKSMRRKVVGFFAGAAEAIPVERPQDIAKKGRGLITTEGGTKVKGHNGTAFKKEVQVGDSIALGEEVRRVVSIDDDSNLTIGSAFSDEDVTTPTAFKIHPKQDQSTVYHTVWEALSEGHCIGIFPEGGSHDRTDLLPLKAGVTLMALGALDQNPDLAISIVPCGLNYFHGHKFRSTVVVQFGKPYVLKRDSDDLLDLYRSNKREACGKLLDTITQRLRSVTINAPDYKTLQAILYARRLYQPRNVKLQATEYMELNRRFAEGYIKFRDDPRVAKGIDEIINYHQELKMSGLKDYHIANVEAEDGPDMRKKIISDTAFFHMLSRKVPTLLVMFVLALPGMLLNLPIGIVVKRIAQKKADEALKASSVKVKGYDVVASYKVLTSMALVPVIYLVYSLIAAIYFGNIYLLPLFYFLLPFFSYFTIIIAQKGVLSWSSLLVVLKVKNSADRLLELKEQRHKLQEQVRQLVEEHGPKMEWWGQRIIAEEDIQLDKTAKRKLSESALAWKTRSFVAAEEEGASAGGSASTPVESIKSTITSLYKKDE
ncbi:Glycerol-3-phosphate/dihydroxyacetone phosphate acyltransferase [Balamuthia mandrillaris]